MTHRDMLNLVSVLLHFEQLYKMGSNIPLWSIIKFFFLTPSNAFSNYYIYYAYSFCFSLSAKISGPWEFVERQATENNRFTKPKVDKGTSELQKWYSLTLLRVRSTCILRLAIDFVFWTSWEENCQSRERGIFNCILCSRNKALMSNPLSAITESPGSKRSRIPLHLAISLSQIPPV